MTEPPPVSMSAGYLVRLCLLGWLAMVGIDFFLHAGLLAGFYLSGEPFLLSPAEAFRRIPLGYLAFLLLSVLLIWLMVRTGIAGWQEGLSFGLKLGILCWGALVLGLLSITTANWKLLIGWWAGQSLELAIAGAVAGHGLPPRPLKRPTLGVLALVAGLILVTLVMQATGLAPAQRI